MLENPSRGKQARNFITNVPKTRSQIVFRIDRENTTQLAKYPHVLYAKPSNKVYILIINCCIKQLSRIQFR